jgi:hypothetical protein
MRSAIALNREDILQLAVVLLAPERLLRAGVDEIDGHPHPPSIQANAAFDGAASPEIRS